MARLEWKLRKHVKTQQQAWSDVTIWEVPIKLEGDDSTDPAVLLKRLNDSIHRHKPYWAQRTSSYGALRWSGGAEVERVVVKQDARYTRGYRAYAIIRQIEHLAD